MILFDGGWWWLTIQNGGNDKIGANLGYELIPQKYSLWTMGSWLELLRVSHPYSRSQKMGACFYLLGFCFTRVTMAECHARIMWFSPISYLQHEEKRHQWPWNHVFPSFGIPSGHLLKITIFDGKTHYLTINDDHRNNIYVTSSQRVSRTDLSERQGSLMNSTVTGIAMEDQSNCMVLYRLAQHWDSQICRQMDSWLVVWNILYFPIYWE